MCHVLENYDFFQIFGKLEKVLFVRLARSVLKAKIEVISTLIVHSVRVKNSILACSDSNSVE